MDSDSASTCSRATHNSRERSSAPPKESSSAPPRERSSASARERSSAPPRERSSTPPYLKGSNWTSQRGHTPSKTPQQPVNTPTSTPSTTQNPQILHVNQLHHQYSMFTASSMLPPGGFHHPHPHPLTHHPASYPPHPHHPQHIVYPQPYHPGYPMHPHMAYTHPHPYPTPHYLPPSGFTSATGTDLGSVTSLDMDMESSMARLYGDHLPYTYGGSYPPSSAPYTPNSMFMDLELEDWDSDNSSEFLPEEKICSK